MLYKTSKYLDTNQTKVVPISLDESERQISLSPRFNHDGISNTLDYSKPGESSRVNEIKLTDRHTEKYSNTVDGAEGKYGKNKRCTGKIIKKIKLQENYMKSSKKLDFTYDQTNNLIEEMSQVQILMTYMVHHFNSMSPTFKLRIKRLIKKVN